MARLAGRCVVLAIAVWMYCAGSDQFFVLEPMGFFSGFSILHLLWGLWVMDMLWQLIPAKRDLALGSKKLFAQHFRPAQTRKSSRVPNTV